MSRHGDLCDCAMCSERPRVSTFLAVFVVVAMTAFCIAVGARDGLFDFFTSLHF